MSVRIIKTLSSIWLFDEEKKEYNRTPKLGAEGLPHVKYASDGWEPYDRIVDDETSYGVRTWVYFSEPHPEHGDWLLTGVHVDE